MASQYWGTVSAEGSPTRVFAHPPRRELKQRFILLDGMRGIAALAVALYHFTLLADRTAHSPNGVVAVDFFFCLSGFVIAYAHDGQLRQGTLGSAKFMALRLLRVLPMVWLGTVLGLALLAFGHGDWLPVGGAIVPTALLSFLGLPWFVHSKAVWIDGVFWSLTAELAANLVYGVIGRRLSDTLLAATIILSAAIFLTAGYHQPPSTGRFETPSAMVFALTCATTEFFIGVALQRIWRNASIRPRVPLILPIVLLLIMLGWMDHGRLVASFNTLAIFTFVPAIVYLGACVDVRRPRLLEFLGAASFPLYALHLPILAAIGQPVGRLPHLVGGLLLYGIPVILLTCGAGVARVIDAPIRQRLRRQLFAARVTTP